MRTTSEAPVAEPQSVNRTPAAAEQPGAHSTPGNGRPTTPAAGVEVEGLRHSFGELQVIQRLDLRVQPGEVLGVVGPSGCGKSTLLELISGLREPVGGRIAVHGDASAATRLRSCAYMQQKDLLLPWLSAIDNASLALRNRGASRSEARAEAGALGRRVRLHGFGGGRRLRGSGVKGWGRARPEGVSGGRGERVAFAAGPLEGKPVALLDEPFG